MRPWFAASPNNSDFDPTFRYETSWILTPTILFIVRGLLSLYACTTIIFIFGYNGVNGLSQNSQQSFSYFTSLTYWGLAFYTFFAALHTCTYAISGTPALARWPRPLQQAHGVFYSTVVVYPWIVTIVFWVLLFSRFESIFATWTNTSQHALNAAYALFEIIFPRTEPMPFIHLIPIVIILALYLALAYITHETEGFYVYNFLDTQTNSSGKVAGYIVGILVAAVVLFLVVRYLIMFRVWVTEKKLGMTGKFSHRGRSREETGGNDAEQGIPLHKVGAK